MSRHGDPVGDPPREEAALPPVDLDVPMVTLKSRKASVPLDAPPAPTAPVHAPMAAPAAAPPMLPPTPVPPVAIPAPNPSDPFLVRHRWHVLGAAVAVAVAAVAAILLLTSGGGDRDRAERLIASGSQEVRRVLTSAGQASKSDALAAAGQDADTALATLGQLDAEVPQIGDDVTRTAVSQVLTADRQVLTALSGLKTLEAKKSSLKLWDRQIHGQITAAGAQLAAATPAVQGLIGVVPPLTSADVDAAASHVDSVVTNGIDELEETDKKRHKAQATNARHAAMARILKSYGTQVTNVYWDYYRDRDKTQLFFRSIAPEIGPGGSHGIDEARTALTEYIADRNDTISRLDAIHAPVGLESAHQGLVGVVHQSLEGLEAFNRAIEEYFRTPPDYGLVDSPSWATAGSISDQVTSQYSAARGAWESALAAKLRPLQTKVKIPALPDV